MKNFSHTNIWCTGSVQIHVDPPPITLIKSKNYMKKEKDSVKIISFRSYVGKSRHVWIKNGLFDKDKLKDLLLFMRNFKITLDASGPLSENAKLQYLHTIIHGEAQYQFDTFCAQVGCMAMEHLNQVILGLGTYFPPSKHIV